MLTTVKYPFANVFIARARNGESKDFISVLCAARMADSSPRGPEGLALGTEVLRWCTAFANVTTSVEATAATKQRLTF
jgi:hypothetical protein